MNEDEDENDDDDDDDEDEHCFLYVPESFAASMLTGQLELARHSLLLLLLKSKRREKNDRAANHAL